MKDIPALLKTHSQRQDWSCSASGHEFIGKLHGKIKDDDFSLQNDPASQKGGFQFEPFLNHLGFTGKNQDASPKDTLKALADETVKGRFPLISSVARVGVGRADFHILVAVPEAGEVALIDPAKQDYVARNNAETLKLLEETCAVVSGRDKVNFLTYQNK